MTRYTMPPKMHAVVMMNGVLWKCDARDMDEALDILGFLPTFFSEFDQRPAREQADANYQHGGGWNSFDGLHFDPRAMVLNFPGDPPMHWQATATLRDEAIHLFECSWVVIVQPDGRYDVARMD